MTHNDETLTQRYQREHDQHLASLEAMTAEQIFGLEVEAHNALAKVEKLKIQRDELVAALKDCVFVMERELKGLAVIQPELMQARRVLSYVEVES